MICLTVVLVGQVELSQDGQDEVNKLLICCVLQCCGVTASQTARVNVSFLRCVDNEQHGGSEWCGSQRRLRHYFVDSTRKCGLHPSQVNH